MLDNIYPESIDESGKYLRLTLQYISKYTLPYNPITYALWYEYATGRNEQLLNDIKILEKDKIDITFDIVLKLFREHVADSQVLLAEKKANEFQAILTEMTHQLGDSGSKLDDQGNSLKKYAKKLSQTNSLEDVSAIAKGIVSKTKSVVASSHTLKKQMDATASEIITLKRELKGIKQTAKTDMLTGLLNRRGFDEAISKAQQYSVAHNNALSIILIDIDHFKRVNDTYGHLIGDNVLKMLSKLLKEQIKGKDIAARFGGEEFILILPETPLKGAYLLAEQIRMSLRTMRWTAKESGKSIGSISVSLGVAQYKPDETVESLIQRADNALYFAKETGRNKTVTELDLVTAGSSPGEQKKGFAKI
jgi:diguanylate cyclase